MAIETAIKVALDAGLLFAILSLEAGPTQARRSPSRRQKLQQKRDEDMKEFLKTVLLVEDKARDVELTVSALTEYNLANAIVVARDGAEALDYLFRTGEYSDRAAGNPCVVLLDIKMPRGNGLRVLERIRADAKLQSVPVVILTSSREEPDLAQAYALGVNAYIAYIVNCLYCEDGGISGLCKRGQTPGHFLGDSQSTPPLGMSKGVSL